MQLALPASLLAQLTINPPTFPTTNTVRVTLTGAASTNAHVILWTPELIPDRAAWYRVVTGSVAQTTFDFTRPTNQNSFFAAAIAPVTTLTVATPVFTPGGGSYALPTNVVITCATDGALIYYTTNGNTPTVLDNFISSGGSVYLDKITTLKAKAFKQNYDESAVATATYNINSAPFVFAGTQQVITASSTTLQGVVIDDGLIGGGTRFTNWSKLSGPGSVVFGNAGVTNTSATFGSDGIYVLQLSASDGQYTNNSQVTIGVNPTISVALTAPGDGGEYTVPTNILLQAEASCSSGSVTQVLLYANSTLIGEATGSPLSLNWKSVFAGNLALRAVAITDDPNNFSLASAPVNITVNWPTNVGQVTLTSTDLQIPVTGLPITVNRQYDSRGYSGGSFGPNGRLDYEAVKIEKNAPLMNGWIGRRSGLTYWVQETSQHLFTVSLSESEIYYFRPIPEFNVGFGNYAPTINSAVVPRYQQGNRGRVSFQSVGGNQGKLEIDPTPSNMGYDDNLSGWNNVPVRLVQGGGLNNYDPSFTQYVFTAPDGTKYRFNGNGGLAVKTDRNGNSLTFSDSGIFHSTGKQITFTRDGNNRITEIYDPIALDTSGSPALTFAYDDNGNLTNMTRLIQRSSPMYETTAYAYTNTAFPNHLTAITDPRGIVSSRYEYDGAGRLAKNLDALGRGTTYFYDTVNHRQVIIDRAGNSTVQTFTDAGQLASVRDATGALTSYEYDEKGRKVAEVSPIGTSVAYDYDEKDQLTGVTDELGEQSEATYNEFGQILVSIDALGNTSLSEYDANGNLISFTNAVGIETHYGYDVQGNRIAITNAFGLPEQVIVLNAYNEFGWLTNTTTLNAQLSTLNSVSYTYDANGNRLSETRTRSAGNVLTQWEYDAANRQTKTIDALGFTNRVFYNGIGKQSQSVDALGRTNRFFYDAVGLLTNTTYADGLTERASYDTEGRKISSVDRAGRTTAYTYDSLGRLTRITFPDGNYTANAYDTAGRLVRFIQAQVIGGGITPPNITELATAYSYDAAGRRSALTNALGQVTRFAYDANGNQTNMVDFLGRTYTYVFDPLNRQTQILYPDGTSESTGYDGLDQRIAITNQAGIVTRFGFDGLGRLTAVTNAFSAAQAMPTRYVYDEVGNLLQQIDALNRTNKFEYDALGRRTKESLPGAQTQTFGYDAVGNLTRLTNFNGVVITNQFDALNRLTNKSSVNGYRVTYTYSPTGQRTNMVDASGTNTFTYDLRDRLLTKTTPQGTLTYTYDGFGNLKTTESSTANGTKITYNYDALNRITNVVDRFTNNTFYAFDGVGNLQTVRYPNNVTNTYTYNPLNRLTNITARSSAGVIASFAYRLAPAGNRTNLIESISGTARTNVWQYDPLYRLTNEVITGASPVGAISYKYDAVGNRTNRTSSVSGVSTVNASFNSNDQLTTDTYDSNGSTTASGGIPYGYDVENRLTNYNSGAATFVYDGDGNRVRKVVSGVTTYYLVDNRNPSGYAQVLEELTTVGSTPSRLYTYGLDLISQRQSDGTTHFYGCDGNGNVRYLTAANATVSDTYTYDAFGIQIASTGSTPNNYRYSGEQLDANMGFYYLRARYLNPATGRFLSRDSFQGDINEPSSIHKYLYVANDPLNRIDPSGLLFTSKFGNAAHAIIQAIYVADHPGEIVIVGSTSGLLGSLLKPDILNMTPTHKVFAEIKPMSLSGVAKGVAQMAAYSVAFGIQGYTPDASWKPSTHFATVGTVPIVFINVGGLIFYSDAVDSTEDVLALASIEAVRIFIRSNQAVLARGLVESFARIRLIAQTGAAVDTVRLEEHVGIASLLAVIGGFAF